MLTHCVIDTFGNEGFRITRNMLRHWEDHLGLFKTQRHKKEVNDYRWFDGECIKRIRSILNLRAFGYSFDEINGILKYGNKGVLDMMEHKIQQLNRLFQFYNNEN